MKIKFDTNRVMCRMKVGHFSLMPLKIYTSKSNDLCKT